MKIVWLTTAGTCCDASWHVPLSWPTVFARATKLSCDLTVSI